MNISEIQPGMTGVRTKGTVKEIEEARSVNTRFGVKEVANAVLEDESGTVKLTLWGDQIKQVKMGNEVEVVNAFAREWRGEIQLSIGRGGELKVLK